MKRHRIHSDEQTQQMTHLRVGHLLPWLLGGTLEDADIALIEAHLPTCPQCQADLDWQRLLRDAAPALDAGFDADRALAKLLPRLGPQAPRAPRIGVLDRWRAALAGHSAWLRWSAAAQLVLIGALALMLVRPAPDGADYRALGAAPRAQDQLVLVFKPDTPEREMRRILRASGARLVDGPTAADAYVLALPTAQASAALARLRAESAVTLAQPLSLPSRPVAGRP